MKLFRDLALATCVAFTATSALANDDAIAAGEVLAQEKGCAGCHGMDGIGIGPTFPNLAGQHRVYLVEQLKHYRSGFRQNAVMGPQSANLTDRDIFELASYYAAQRQP